MKKINWAKVLVGTYLALPGPEDLITPMLIPSQIIGAYMIADGFGYDLQKEAMRLIS